MACSILYIDIQTPVRTRCVPHAMVLSSQEDELVALAAEVRRLGFGAAGAGVTRAEFAVAMLVSIGKLEEVDVQKALKTFDKLDIEKDGVLDMKDLVHR